MRNPGLLVSIHGYEGDSHQIRNMLKFQEHHGAPVVVFSPEDSPIKKMGPHICRFVGKRQYIGQLSLDRQRDQLTTLLEYPFDWFLSNDSDSLCLSPKLPAYLFERKDVLWSNVVSEGGIHTRPEGYPWPQIAFQPPYFFSRDVLRRLISVDVPADPKTPFIDWVMMAWAVAAKISYANFRDGISCPTSDPVSLAAMSDAVTNRGVIFVHSIKSPRVLNQVIGCHRHHTRKFGGPAIVPPEKGVRVRFDKKR